jgi:hypothetical protein
VFQARFETAGWRCGREGKREGEGGVRPRECHAARGQRPIAARARRAWATCAARSLPTE